MPFTAEPLIGGDAFELASRVAQDTAEELASLPDSSEQMACIARHWQVVAELGWMAIAIPEEVGGAGGSLADLAALACGAGRGGLPLPIPGACAVVPHLLSAAGGEARAILAQVATGKARICSVLPGAPQQELRFDDGVLDGSIIGAETPPEPTHLLLATEGANPALVLLPVTAEGLSLTRYQRIDGRLAADWRLGHVSVGANQVLTSGAQVAQLAEEARDLGALLTCVEIVSALGTLIEQTIAYLLNRVQFGAPLAANQALRHRIAEMYVEYENLRALVGHALRSAEETGSLAWRDVAFAKLRLGHAGRFIAEAAIQCHGGMGMTEELPAIRLARRALMAEFEYGDRVFQARRLIAADGRASA